MKDPRPYRACKEHVEVIRQLLQAKNISARIVLSDKKNCTISKH